MNKSRTSDDIREIFESRGCTVKVRPLGDSYRAGGEIFIYAPGVEPESQEGFEFTPADFAGFDGTGYDGRGRQYSVWLIKAGDYVPATPAEYYNTAEDRRVCFGDEHRSCSNVIRFVHKDELKKSGLSDLGSAFAALGL